MHRLAIFGLCAALAGCATEPPATKKAASTKNSGAVNPDLDTLPWRWEQYSNRVWIAVAGVGLEVGSSNTLTRIHFSYSPNSGRSPDEAIAIQSFNMFTGRRAEQFLLRVLFGAVNTNGASARLVSNGKAFHIYEFRDGNGVNNTIYFDGTKYHNLF